MDYIGIDIGSTSAKTAVLNEAGEVTELFVLPTGWSSFDALERIEERLQEKGIALKENPCVSTGYGRKSAGWAKNVTEITCHAIGAALLFSKEPIHVIDVGGQDTKVISCRDGKVEEFYMNDKCSAGTGKFLEIMAGRLNIPVEEVGDLARKKTKEVTISSLCTVFAESEVVALIGQGVLRENIAWGVLNSIAVKVWQEYSKLKGPSRPVYLTGGLCGETYFTELLASRIGKEVHSDPRARFAGALGAAKLAYGENA